MTPIWLMFLGSLVGLGVLVIRLALRGTPLFGRLSSGRDQVAVQRVSSAVVAGVAFWIITDWLMPSLVVAAAVYLVVNTINHRHEQRGHEEISEAIALWTEQLRDTLAAAHGLQQTLVATAPHAPDRIRQAVQRLAAKLPYAPAGTSLREFASEVDHSSADFVVAALISATEHEARDVGSLLGHLAKCSRDEARMHQRIWVGRARTRTAVRIIFGTVIVFVSVLVLLNRDYLTPYGTASGQVILSAIVATFATALFLLQKGSDVQVPERFIAVSQ